MYFLSTCSTCAEIMKKLQISDKDFVLQDIKTEKITPAQLEEMKNITGSYESLFSRRALKYKSMKLAEKKLSESDYKKLILQEYTFLKRPVLISGKEIFVGNAPKTVDAAKKFITR